jgi:dephospho-CoA kinase
MSNPKANLLLLIGAKGSGKSYIGAVLEREMGIPFLRAEPIWKAIKEDASVPTADYIGRGIDAIIMAASELAGQYACFSLESTGAFDDMPAFIDRFRPFCRLRLIYVRARPETCLQRVHARDRSIHIDVSDALVTQVNTRAFALQLPYEATIENDPFASINTIVEAVRYILESHA